MGSCADLSEVLHIAGAHGGVRRNFALMAEVLREHASQNAPVVGTL